MLTCGYRSQIPGSEDYYECPETITNAVDCVKTLLLCGAHAHDVASILKLDTYAVVITDEVLVYLAEDSFTLKTVPMGKRKSLSVSELLLAWEDLKSR